uniref:Uncharacterized protein n=1 Tax=Anguilla anguilla TaxID=7936 RepID=A0A0E9RTK6_ANGAN
MYYILILITCLNQTHILFKCYRFFLFALMTVYQSYNGYIIEN